MKKVDFGLKFTLDKHDAADKLQKKCFQLYNLLLEAHDAVKYMKEKEKKEKRRLKYYDSDGRTSNHGYTGLYEDIEKALNSYSYDMMKIAIEN